MVALRNGRWPRNGRLGRNDRRGGHPRTANTCRQFCTLGSHRASAARPGGGGRGKQPSSTKAGGGHNNEHVSIASVPQRCSSGDDGDFLAILSSDRTFLFVCLCVCVCARRGHFIRLLVGLLLLARALLFSTQMCEEWSSPRRLRTDSNPFLLVRRRRGSLGGGSKKGPLLLLLL